MSEYQYYEFQAVDRRLSEKDMQKLRACSSRAEITPTSFTTEYHYGDFRGNEDLWMEKYFDGFMYTANWGTRILMLGLPAKVFPLSIARPYCTGDWMSVREKSGRVIVKFTWDKEGGDEQECESLSSLLPLRDDLSLGDLRCLYIGWLSGVQSGECEEDQTEPPVPANLGHLSAPLESLVEFLQIDSDLLSAAAEASAKTAPMEQKGLAALVKSLPTSEKDELLIRLLDGKSAPSAMELRARFARSLKPPTPSQNLPRRTAGELLIAAENLRESVKEKKTRGRKQRTGGN